MKFRFLLTCTGIAASMMVAGSAAMVAQAQSLTLLNRFQAGQWEMRSRGEPVELQRICVRDARRFIQMRHPGQNCTHTVIEDKMDEVTVQYTCRGSGYGRTHIRRESDGLWQIDSQGIAKGLPFTFDAEVRRLGDCSH
ncbi:DUF3617 family protein [Novosphingobium sp. RD2P27]|uniref:DUF3617 family protein n=1 Tax=Novosphingobium kalidii TaxID=3230299 RepID=A0ABV2CZN1_9SPHN